MRTFQCGQRRARGTEDYKVCDLLWPKVEKLVNLINVLDSRDLCFIISVVFSTGIFKFSAETSRNLSLQSSLLLPVSNEYFVWVVFTLSVVPFYRLYQCSVQRFDVGFKSHASLSLRA
ncbi:hypothetical protein PoB_001724900 [Plakobranchus ocellatus]|uniref:Uncharacterized protein n=1 Tax=Plakobranchus ocellatus TaxID=259542 RepID=A0AAV3Z9W8_9GAST|nr:hypothetical protein PoB_001724900 [Plakobranchus ocellatus]